jgi:hypothetical protein
VIVGSAAGALIGLQFVVMTLIAERPPLRAAEAGAAFAPPTIVHFGAALLLSALFRAPWPTVTRGLAVPLPPAFGGVRHTCAIAFRGVVLRARRFICGRRCSAAVALRRHSQCLGCRFVPRLCEQQDKDAGSRQDEISERDLP